MKRSTRTDLLYLAPFAVFVAWFFLPVMAGRQTLFLRDVLNIHLEMKWVGAQALRQGHLLLIDLLRSGGQPQLGNPNTVSLYPDNLIFLVASPIWGVNAHFWLHLLLAPLAMFYLGRQMGLGRPGAWMAGVCYATGGYYLSTLNLFNLTAAVTLGPALVAAAISLMRSPEPDAAGGGDGDAAGGAGALVACCLLWTLVVLGGDPMLAAALLGAALGAAIAASGRLFHALRRLAMPIGIGTLLAAPQLVEFLRILPNSYRGVQGYSVAAATASSWSPANLFEWLIPMAFGKPDLLFWGKSFHAGYIPLLYSLSPGLVALALAFAATRSGWRWNRFVWGMVAVGFFFALGSYNPLAKWLFGLPGMSIFRLPVKLWILAAIGLALAAGRGMEGIVSEGRSRRAERALLVLGATVSVIALLLVAAPSAAADLLASRMPASIPPQHSVAEVSRWLRIAVASAALCALGWVLMRLSARRATLAGVGLVALQCLGQGGFLGSLMATDSVEPYLRPSPLLDLVPPEARVVHGEANSFSERIGDREDYPDASPKWVQRDVFVRLFPPAGIMHGLRYEFWLTPEGLDSFLSRAVAQALQLVDDPDRLSFLESSGVTHLLLGRDLEDVGEDRVTLVARRQAGTADTRIYHLERSAAEVEFAGRVLRSTDPRRTANLLLDPTFDARTSVVLAGPGEPSFGGEGSVEVVDDAPEKLSIEVAAQSPGAVLVQRSYLPIWKATLDGEPVEISVANMHRMAVEVPAGRHRLELWVDRSTLAPSFALSGLALVLLVLQARRRRRPPGTPDEDGRAGALA